MRIYSISVRELVEFIYRSGDLDNRRGAGGDLRAMQEGARIHRLLQNQEGPEYAAEVPLSASVDCGTYEIRLDGRADGIIEGGQGFVIDEIKGVYTDVDRMEEPVFVHLAQAKCYAAMVLAKDRFSESGEDTTEIKLRDLPEAGVRMTYCEIETMKIRRFFYTFSAAELDAWFSETIEKLRKWTDRYFEDLERCIQSAKAVVFPYDYRPGQFQLSADVYRSVTREKLLFLQAPTGTGKTISTVFPAVKALGEEQICRIFYLTAKTVTAKAAESAVSLLREKGLLIKQLRLTAKEKMCVCEETDCNPEHCPRAKGHFDRVNEAVFELLQTEEVYTRENLLSAAERHMVCPFEMQLDLSSWCAFVIGDYNYAFDPNVKLKRFFGGGNAKQHVLLIDEAHNLVDRGRTMFSAGISKEAFLLARRYMKILHKSIAKSLTQCNQSILEIKKQGEELRIIEEPVVLITRITNLVGKIERFLAKVPEFPQKKEFLEFYFDLKNFLSAYERADEHYLTVSGTEEDSCFWIRFLCVDPSKDLQECLDLAKSAVFFSATLLPVNYYKKLLCTKEDPYAVYAKSVFKESQRKILIGCDVTTKYTRRGPEEYRKMAAYIKAMAEGRTGNYMAFFPSYRMMEDVKEEFDALTSGTIRTLSQRSGMTEAEREEFLNEFDHPGAETLVGFCVLGGIFGEGIDLASDRLIGAAVVGTGLPQVSKERELLKDYFEERDQNGFSFAYRYPGMNKILQAAGRVIRTEEDRGVILLLDERFLQKENRAVFPKEWKDVKTVRLEEVSRELEEFWKS